jgi:hypothetical protein
MNRSTARRHVLPLALATLVAAVPTASLAQAAGSEPAAGLPSSAPPLVITGYGEINYNRPSDPADQVADLRRFVFGLHYRFAERTRLVSEVEIEHAVSSADDVGEVALEQAYVEHQFSATWAGRAGLILLPVGMLNESHEPTAYYGVERNFVETAIIPTTWREGAIQAVGTFENGLTLSAGVSTGFDINTWDATSGEGRAKPLGSIHQELSKARAHDGAVFAALNWRGVPGLLVGGSAFVGGAAQGQPGTPSTTTALWDVHARWTPWRLDLSALYARGSISNTAALNAPLVGNPTLIPATFFGWYAQAAVRAWSEGELALAPFVRYERFNTGASYADLGPGVTPADLETEAVLTAGVNFWVTAGVVLKADYQKFAVATTQDRIDLGLGWSF